MQNRLQQSSTNLGSDGMVYLKLIFAFSSLPSYTNDDPIGVELAGAGKVRCYEVQEEVAE